MAEPASKPAILTEGREKNRSERHAMLKRPLQTEHAITVEGLINSPGLQPPK